MSFCSANTTAADACTMDDLRFIAGLAYSVAAAVAVLPSLFLLSRLCFRMLKRRSEDNASTVAVRAMCPNSLCTAALAR